MTATAGIVYTDEPLVAGVTLVKAVHLTEVRTAVSTARATAGLAEVAFADPMPNGVVVKATHIIQLRNALDEARAQLGLVAISYTDPGLASGMTVRGVHIQQLRDGARLGPNGCSAITAINPSRTTFTVDTPLTATFTQSGAVNGAVFSLASGVLPAGVTLSPSGTLSGTPAEIGSFPITVRVRDGNGCTATGPSYAMQIVEAPAILSFTHTWPTVPSGPVTLTATFSGGTGVITNGQNADIAAASGTTYEVTPDGNTVYTLTVTNAAGDHVSTTLSYVVPAFLRINELTATVNGNCDLIELRVISGGSMGGIKLHERTGSVNGGELNLTFPTFQVQTNDIVVVHMNSTSATCNPNGATQETDSPAEQPRLMFSGNFDTAYDFYSPDTGLADTDNVFTVRNPGSVIMDALLVSDDPNGTSTSTASESAADEVIAADQWSPAGVTYRDNVFRMHAVDDLDATGTSPGTNSIQRVDNTDDDDKTDWTSGAGSPSSWGANNAGQSQIVTPTLTINNVAVAEGNSGTRAATFTVALSAASVHTVSVNFSTAGGTATAGQDFVSDAGTLVFPPGSTTQLVTVLVNGDTSIEPDESFVVTLSGATNATIGDADGVGSILNDDAEALPAISIDDGGRFNELDPPSNQRRSIVVRLSFASASEVKVNYASTNGTAVAGSDFIAISGTLTFPPGQLTGTITLNIIADSLFEADEQMFIDLSSPVNATIAVSRSVLTILNDD